MEAEIEKQQISLEHGVEGLRYAELAMRRGKIYVSIGSTEDLYNKEGKRHLRRKFQTARVSGVGI